MLRDIAHLDKTEIEGIILEPSLVYATLFGYADRSASVMALRQIHWKIHLWTAMFRLTCTMPL